MHGDVSLQSPAGLSVLGFFRGYIVIMENKMETTIIYTSYIKGFHGVLENRFLMSAIRYNFLPGLQHLDFRKGDSCCGRCPATTRLRNVYLSYSFGVSSDW